VAPRDELHDTVDETKLFDEDLLVVHRGSETARRGG
jgi:hypothetical protein